MVIEAMDGRKRGQILRDPNGRFTTRVNWNRGVQTQIDQYYQDIARRSRYLDQNPDLKVLNDADRVKIEDLEKERRLVNNSKRGINDRVKIYREAMEKQGLKGQQLEEQVARYKEGLLAERKKHFNKLKGKQIRRNIASGKLKVKPKEQPKQVKGISKFFKGKGGKIGLALGAAALIGGAIFGLSKCSDDKEAETPVTPTEPETPTTPTHVEEQPTPVEETPVTPAQPEQPEQPAYEPIVSLNDDGTYTTKKGDNFYKLAENLLKDYCAQNNIDKTITAESPEVQILAERIMRKNEYWYDPNCTEANKRYSVPMLYPDLNLNMVNFEDLVKKEEKPAA